MSAYTTSLGALRESTNQARQALLKIAHWIREQRNNTRWSVLCVSNLLRHVCYGKRQEMLHLKSSEISCHQFFLKLQDGTFCLKMLQESSRIYRYMYRSLHSTGRQRRIVRARHYVELYDFSNDFRILALCKLTAKIFCLFHDRSDHILE